MSLLENVGLSTQAEDCAIVPINSKQYLLSNIDIFTAIHDDPYIMGKIAACNVTNDLFALNALSITLYDNFIGIPQDIPPTFPEEIIRGIQDFLTPLGAKINGGHTIYNPWPLFGGSAVSIIEKDHIIRKYGIHSGDKIILTKPLGVQPVMAAYRVLKDEPSWLVDFDQKSLNRNIDIATQLMTTSNNPITRLIHEKEWYSEIHAMTDVTGFGLLGHLSEMLGQSEMGINISQIPVIDQSPALAELFGYQLAEGKSPEIAGGMLMSVSDEIYQDLITEMDSKKIFHFCIGNMSKNLSGIKFSDHLDLVEFEKVL